MKLFKKMRSWWNCGEHQFYLYIWVLIVPNVALNFTEPLSVAAKLCNLLLPFSCYYLLMTLSKNYGRMFWLLFPFAFLGAFQIVLLYLFGHSIIAVDMFLNLVTTNSSEVFELLNKLLPAIGTVLILYIPPLVTATIAILKKHRLRSDFLRVNRKRAFFLSVAGLLSLGIAASVDSQYAAKRQLFPCNVLYNAGLAWERSVQSEAYYHTSAGYLFHAHPTHPEAPREIYVLVVGETSRADDWSLCGYGRDTNPKLSREDGLTSFADALSESNTTHKSVPMLLSEVHAPDFDSIYYRKGVITAFKEAGFHTAFFSNQRYNRSFIDFFGKEADTWRFIKEEAERGNKNPLDEELLPLVVDELAKGYRKQLIVLHTYGSHFNYHERYPQSAACFLPDRPDDARVEYRNNLLNAYDNSIRYTDDLLARLIDLLKQTQVDAALLYTSDHGEDIFDDRRELFLHASPIPSYYQIHVPFLVWMSDNYRRNYPTLYAAALQNREKRISSSASFFHTAVGLAGIDMPVRNDTLSVVSPLFREHAALYLDDHNRALPLEDTGMGEEDFRLLNKKSV
ncbi:MAG: lipid A phosphoethanolamine transferase [Prevotellaceae bacterium]|nr:lipid A phosphoethanolamine transferase [Prevotellaceae bacterium]